VSLVPRVPVIRTGLARLTCLAVIAGVVAAVTGCAGKATTYASPSTPASAPAATTSAAPAPTVSMSALPGAAGQLTGTQLATVLLPASDFPGGFALSSSSAVTSGDSLVSAPAQYNLATVGCADFVNHLGSTGFGETAMAANSFVGQAQAFDQVVYQFGSAAAASSFVAGIEALAGRCHSFSATDNGATGTFSLRASPAAPVGGHPSLELMQSGTISGSSLTIDTLFTASGVDVFAGAAVGLGTTAPVSLAKQTIVYELMKRQAAAAVLG
jgi:hypothetical protein